MLVLILYSDSLLFSQSLKRFLQRGECGKILCDRFGIKEDNDFICTDSLTEMEAIVKKKEVGLVLVDLDMREKTGIQFLKGIRSRPELHLKAPAIITSFIYLGNLLDDPENSILEYEKGHYFMKKPFSFPKIKRKLEIAEPLCDDELNEVIETHCTLVGVFDRVLKELSNSLQTGNRDDIKQPAKALRLLLQRRLSGYFDAQIKYLDEAQLLFLREIIPKALKVQAFHSLFHGSRYDFINNCGSSRLAISNFLSRGTHGIGELTRVLECSKWWIELENELLNVNHQLETAFGYESPFLESSTGILRAFQTFREYIGYIEGCRSQDSRSEVEQRSRTAVGALDNMMHEIMKIKRESDSIRRGNAV